MRIIGTLGRAPRARSGNDWRSAVSAYLLDPMRWWCADGESAQAREIEAAKAAVRRRDGLGDREIVAEVVAMAARRRRQRPAPISVTGLAHSGSRWAADMLGEIPGVVSVGAVDAPTRLLDDLAALPIDDQACAMDALALLHGWPRTPHVWASHLVSYGSGVHNLRRRKRHDPRAVGVYLVRDPRDQVLAALSSTAVDTGRERETAHQRLRRAAARNVASFEQAAAVADLIDVRCRYEDLCNDPRPLLRGVLQALDRPVDEVDPDTDGGPPPTLQGDGPPPLWHDDRDDPAQRRLLHAYLVDVVHGLGYAPDDCVGTPLPDHTLPPRTLRDLASAPGPLYQRVAGEWVRVRAHAPKIDAGASVMLRVPSGADLVSLRHWAGDDIQALCLANNAGAGDDALRSLAAMAGLRTLDLARTPVTDAGLAHLIGLTALQQLHVAQTATTAQGRADLARRLPQLTIWT